MFVQTAIYSFDLWWKKSKLIVLSGNLEKLVMLMKCSSENNGRYHPPEMCKIRNGQL